SRETLHHGIESRQLFRRNGPRTAGEQSDFVREEVCERIRAHRDSQAQGHSISPAKILAHQHQEKGEGSQQKGCANHSHFIPCLLKPCEPLEILPLSGKRGAHASSLPFYPLDSRCRRGL